MAKSPVSASTLNVYQIAYLCGGTGRVAQVAVVSLWLDGRIKIAASRHRVTAVSRAPRDPVETIALEVLPDTGMRLRPMVVLVAGSAATAEVVASLRRSGVRRGRLPLWSARGRRLRRDLVSDLGTELRRIAVLGTPAIEDEQLRRTFQQPDPHPSEWSTAKRKPRGVTSNPAPDGRVMKGAAKRLEREIERSESNNDHDGASSGGDFGGGDFGGGDSSY